MTLQELTLLHQPFLDTQACFYVEVIHDDIWGDNGVDSATVSIVATKQNWHLHYIRTHSGIPYFLAEYRSTIVDEYEKTMDHAALYDFLALHQQLDSFANYAKRITNKEDQ